MREQLSREEWQLTAEGMQGDLILMIAKARWIYGKGRCSMDNNQKKMNIESVMQNLWAQTYATHFSESFEDNQCFGFMPLLGKLTVSDAYV